QLIFYPINSRFKNRRNNYFFTVTTFPHNVLFRGHSLNSWLNKYWILRKLDRQSMITNFFKNFFLYLKYIYLVIKKVFLTLRHVKSFIFIYYMEKYYNKPLNIGIVGTGGIARGLAKLITNRRDMKVSGILTRRTGTIADLGVSQDLLTLVPERLMEVSDVIVVSTGDPLYSTEIID